MFESKINRGKANGYAPLDGSGKVPLDKLPPIQSTIDTGSFATTGSNTFYDSQTIVGNVTFPSSSFISTTNPSGALFISTLNKGTLQLNADANEGDVIIGRSGGWEGKLWLRGNQETDGNQIINGNQSISGSVNISSSLVVSSTFVNNGTIDALNSDLIIDGGDIILSGSLLISGSINGVDNLVTTSSFNTFSSSIDTTFAKNIRIFSDTTATITVAEYDSGKVYIGKRSSSTQIFTLPSASTAGLTYTFICGDVGGMVQIKGQAGDTINCKSNADGTDRVSVSVAATTGIRNNAATNVLGDNITLVSDGITTWWMTAQSGIFSSL
jgi:hypothetical protein